MTLAPGEAKRLLLERREELQQLAEASEEARAPVRLDQQAVGRLSRMDAMQQQAMSRAEDGRRQQELARIEAALRRLQDDPEGYGHCLSCGDLIADRRLRLDPAITRCIACAH